MLSKTTRSEPFLSRWSVLLIALAAVDWPSVSRLEGHLRLAPAVGACYREHLPRARVEPATSASARLFTHFYYLSYFLHRTFADPVPRQLNNSRYIFLSNAVMLGPFCWINVERKDHACGSIMTFRDSPPAATNSNPIWVSASGRRWVTMSSTVIFFDAIRDIACLRSPGAAA